MGRLERLGRSRAVPRETQRDSEKWKTSGGSPATSLGTLLVFQTLTPLNLQFLGLAHLILGNSEWVGSGETQREPEKWRLGGGSPATSLITLLVFQALTPLNLQFLGLAHLILGNSDWVFGQLLEKHSGSRRSGKRVGCGDTARFPDVDPPKSPVSGPGPHRSRKL